MRTSWTGKLLLLFLIAMPVAVFAHSYGPAPRKTGAPGDDPLACTACHTGTAFNSGSGSIKIILQGGPFYVPGFRQRITVQVADPGQQRWGFELTARLSRDLQNGQAGDLNPVDNQTQVICEDAGPKPCATGVQFIEQTSAGTRNGTSGGATFQFDWNPPTTDAGPVTLFAAGNAANGNGSPTGDLIYTTSVQLTPAVAAAPQISSIVSSATYQSGSFAANSWVTIFGTNLSPTSRSWTNGDILNGGLPFSLDGVSVVLTGAPRLAYVGYVSPTQVNFLLPTDQGPATVQVQVRNSAGISARVPITVQANAPQLLTSDAKYVLATHADGRPLTKATPAAPGEIVTLYGTGCGATTPAQITGQVPTIASPLATLPTITVGGVAASVTAGSISPGAAGVYQFAVQIPAAAADGDQPVVATQGGVGSAPTLITVQK
jgi:uncharacterized protein (TIGR03437 family)